MEINKQQLDNFIDFELKKILQEGQAEVDSLNLDVKKIKQIIDASKSYSAKLTTDVNKSEKESIDKKVSGLQNDLSIKQKMLNNAIQQANVEKTQQAQNQSQQTNSPIAQTAMSPNIGSTSIKEGNQGITLKRKFALRNEQQIQPIQQQTQPIQQPIQQTQPIQEPKKKSILVQFDKNTQYPFNVKFTNRGFLIAGTRLSFELLEKALNKKFTITLQNGFILDYIRMQKILKYKERI